MLREDRHGAVRFRFVAPVKHRRLMIRRIQGDFAVVKSKVVVAIAQAFAEPACRVNSFDPLRNAGTEGFCLEWSQSLRRPWFGLN